MHVQYTAAGGPLGDTASNSSMRLQWEGDPAVDLRARPNNLGVLPTSYAGIMPGNVALERMLHPRLPVALVIRQEDPAWSGFDGGAPRPHPAARASSACWQSSGGGGSASRVSLSRSRHRQLSPHVQLC